MTLDPRQPALNKEIFHRPITVEYFKTWPYLIFVVRGDRQPGHDFDDVEFTNVARFLRVVEVGGFNNMRRWI